MLANWVAQLTFRTAHVNEWFMPGSSSASSVGPMNWKRHRAPVTQHTSPFHVPDTAAQDSMGCWSTIGSGRPPTFLLRRFPPEARSRSASRNLPCCCFDGSAPNRRRRTAPFAVPGAQRNRGPRGPGNPVALGTCGDRQGLPHRGKHHFPAVAGQPGAFQPLSRDRTLRGAGRPRPAGPGGALTSH